MRRATAPLEQVVSLQRVVTGLEQKAGTIEANTQFNKGKAAAKAWSQRPPPAAHSSGRFWREWARPRTAWAACSG